MNDKTTLWVKAICSIPKSRNEQILETPKHIQTYVRKLIEHLVKVSQFIPLLYN